MPRSPANVMTARAGSWCARPGFTLLEVMIGILILALALLGLGAVIPAVIRTQKLATDAASGVTVANSVASYLKAREDLNRLTPPPIPPPGIGRMGWGVWLLDPGWSPETGSPRGRYLWEPLTTTGSPPQLDPGTGSMHFVYSGSNPPSPVTITVADRVWPARYCDGTDPAYVWDFIGRRVETLPGTPRKVQLAVFVRRIDPNVAIPIAEDANAYRFTLYDVLTGTLPKQHQPAAPAAFPAALRRLPLTVPAPPAAPFPTLDGTINGGANAYSTPLVATVRFAAMSARPDRLIFDGAPEPGHRDLVAQPGQKLVDNLGNIYTVLGFDERNTDQLIIDPPAPVWVNDRYGSLGAPHPAVAPERSLRQVAFTPHVPAAVTVITITPQDPK